MLQDYLYIYIEEEHQIKDTISIFPFSGKKKEILWNVNIWKYRYAHPLLHAAVEF